MPNSAEHVPVVDYLCTLKDSLFIFEKQGKGNKYFCRRRNDDVICYQ